MKNTFNQHLLLLAGTALPVTALAVSPIQKPNIMLIVVDDMGYSDLGCYGGEVITPNLDQLANTGVRFSQFYNVARSCPSRACLLTGRYAQETGITAMGRSLTNDCVTIPEVLKSAGYHTSMVGKWHLSLTQGRGNREEQMKWLAHQASYGDFAPKATYPSNRGFEEHFGTIWGVGNFFDPFSFVHNETPIENVPKDFYYTDYITDKSVELIDNYAQGEKPFFMYVAYTAPHWPLHAKPEDIAKYKGKYDEGWDVLRQKRYNKMVELGLIDPATTPFSNNESGRSWETEPNKAFESANMEVHAAMVDCVDQGVGKIIEKLIETGQYDNTIIFFMSDNGASPENYTIGDFDRPDRTRDNRYHVRNSATPGDEVSFNYLGSGWAGALNTPYRYWKVESFNGGTATPFIAHMPSSMQQPEAGSIIRSPYHFIDMLPTCMDYAGASYPQTYNSNIIKPIAPEGKSLKEVLKSGADNEERTLFWEHEGGKAARKGDWKLVALRNQSWQLFNLANDLSETNNVAIEYPDKVKELKALWNQWAVRVGLKVEEEIATTKKELAFYYSFDDNITDSSDKKYVLTSNGHDFSGGVFGRSLLLNGQAQYLDLNTTSIVNTANTQYTVCAWVYDDEESLPSSGGIENNYYFRDEIILAQKDNEGTGRIILSSRVENPVIGGAPRLLFDNFLGGKHNLSSPGLFERGKWVHVAVLCDPVSKSITYYRDGVRDLTVPTNAFEACNGGFRIGGHKAGKDYWHGKIDELYLFKGLLSIDDINKIYHNTYFEIASTNAVSKNKCEIVYDGDKKILKAISQFNTIDSIFVYSSTGVMLNHTQNSDKLSMSSLSNGVYIVRVVDSQNNIVSKKIVVS